MSTGQEIVTLVVEVATSDSVNEFDCSCDALLSLTHPTNNYTIATKNSDSKRFFVLIFFRFDLINTLLVAQIY